MANTRPKKHLDSVDVSTTKKQSEANIDTLMQLQLLQDEHDNLQKRYTALFQLNQLSQECEELENFYPQVHRTIASLMTANNFYIVSEIDFTGYTSKKLNINPYVSYRLMLSNAEMDDDNLKINELSFGLRMDINK